MTEVQKMAFQALSEAIPFLTERQAEYLRGYAKAVTDSRKSDGPAACKKNIERYGLKGG